MLWPGHIITNRIVLGEWSLWSIAPDVPMALFSGLPYKWSEMKQWSSYSVVYKLPHSFLILGIIPRRYRFMYALHILLDIISHTGDWSIQPFYPFAYTVNGIFNAYIWT